MASDFTGTALTLAAVVAIAVAGAWAWSVTENDAPLDEAVATPLQSRVIFLDEETRLETPIVTIPASGIVTFPPLAVDLTNVTFVTVTLHMEVAGPAAGDRILVNVENPSGASRDAESTGPVNLAGYHHSRAVIDDWKHATKPREVVYATQDVAAAEAWSAANHTDTSALGGWKASVEVTPGQFAGVRGGTVSLGFVFRHYTGLAVLEEVTSVAPEAMDEAPDAMDGEPVLAARGEDAPRTFFTGAGLDRVVDRGPRPHGPL